MERDGNVEKAILAEMGKPHSGLIDRVTRHNQIILHNYRKSVDKACECHLPGCLQSFDVTLIPNQVLYPKYCEAHRTEFRRQNFLRLLAAQTGIFRIEAVRVIESPDSVPDEK